jgi:hypothetical protein
VVRELLSSRGHCTISNFHDTLQVDLSFPANSRTITRLMDAWWGKKVNVSSGPSLVCIPGQPTETPPLHKTY